ncbi:MAG: NUDIX domain-containing protein [Kofleriaceae bacterium]|nr:NUDIX domain-containing protein [Kofleriaceae bacterium]
MTTAHATIAIAAAVFNRRGDILLIQRGRPPDTKLWSLPGGKLHAFESLAAGVAREVREETGLAVEVGPHIAVIERMSQPSATDTAAPFHYVIIDYLARLRQPDAAPRANDDALDARFVPRADMEGLPITDGLVPIVQAAWQRAIELGWVEAS